MKKTKATLALLLALLLLFSLLPTAAFADGEGTNVGSNEQKDLSDVTSDVDSAIENLGYAAYKIEGVLDVAGDAAATDPDVIALAAVDEALVQPLKDLDDAKGKLTEAQTAEKNAKDKAKEATEVTPPKDEADAAEAAAKAAGSAASEAGQHAAVAADTDDRATAWTYAYNSDQALSNANAEAKTAAENAAAAQAEYARAQAAYNAALAFDVRSG